MIRTEQTHTQDIRAQQATVAVLGYAVFWRLSGVQIAHTDLAAALKAAGFGSFVPALPQPGTALRRALLFFAQHSLQETVLLRCVSHTPCVLALVHEAPDQAGSLTYLTRLRACYDPVTRNICCTRTSSGPIDATTEDPRVTAAVRFLFQDACQTHTGEDLSRVLRAIISSLSAVRLQRGVYFVPARESAPLQRLDAVVAGLPGAPLFATLARLDERRTRERLVHAIHADLMRDLDAMEARLAQMRAAQPQPETQVLAQHLVRFRTVQNKAQIYTELLGARVQEIRTRLEAVQAGVQHLVLFDVEDLLPE
jgi:hypothetical protein